MRYPASEKAEIIQLVEQSHLPAGRTLDKLGIPRATFYRWYDRYREGGIEALADHRSRPDRVWNRIPDVAVSATHLLARQASLIMCLMSEASWHLLPHRSNIDSREDGGVRWS
jgi:transposase-like protein